MRSRGGCVSMRNEILPILVRNPTACPWSEHAVMYTGYGIGGKGTWIVFMYEA